MFFVSFGGGDGPFDSLSRRGARRLALIRVYYCGNYISRRLPSRFCAIAMKQLEINAERRLTIVRKGQPQQQIRLPFNSYESLRLTFLSLALFAESFLANGMTFRQFQKSRRRHFLVKANEADTVFRGRK